MSWGGHSSVPAGKRWRDTGEGERNQRSRRSGEESAGDPTVCGRGGGGGSPVAHASPP
ncbi:unnamed protein product [Spirodela intermedia]|uniref:Uncharacterized protein n=1 Tax=Spirodela intermedia TaxID=51605 RepID=A0A7I8JC28_SPIIN|nr:unnamed protein product [Spirodela intermedia]CAA6667679.1 unnamed protein product [Spirodela intermedia]